MADLEKAKRKIDKVIFKFWKEDTIIFGALSLLDKIPDSNYSTIGIDVSNSDRVSLRFNPNFILAISIERLELVLVIEALRLLLRHCTTRLREPGNISKLASSLAINELFNEDMEKLIQGIQEFTVSPKQFGLDEKLSFEEYYRGLLEKQDNVNEKIQQIWNSMSEEQKFDAVQKAIDNYNQEQEEKEQNSDEDNFQEFENEKEAIKKYTDPNSNSNDGWGKNNGFDADVKRFVDRVKNRTKQWGKYSKDAQATILAALEPKVSCSDIIRKFNCSILTGKSVSSRMKINRRFDIERPGYRRVYKPHVIFAVDVSGSMSDDDLAYGFGVINRLLHHAKITFVEFDTEIKKVEKNLNKARKSFHVHGRGGTDFEKIMEMADKELVDGVIIYSDMYAPAPHKPKCKVLWLCAQKNQSPPVQWGYRAFLNRYSDDKIF